MNRKLFGKITSMLLAGVTACAVCGGCSENADFNADKPHPTATITVRDYGAIELELYQEIAPNTVANFISLAKSGFYDGLIFHRVIEDFMIQGGDPKGTGMGGPGYAIKGEFTQNGFTNTLKHEPGVISMARSTIPDSAGSQFFICTAVYPSLDGKYAAFGKVTSGLEVAYEISKTATDRNDKPLTDVVIESIKIDEKGGDYSHVEKIKK